MKRREFGLGLLATALAAVAGTAAAQPFPPGPPPPPGPPGFAPPPPGFGPGPPPPPGAYGYGPRRRRCWTEERVVWRRDAWGRPYQRAVPVRICR